MTFRADFAHRDDLRVAAVNEFCARGYDAASINRILAASGVSKGQLYHHFDGKEGLYLALVEWMIDTKVAWFTTNPITVGNDVIDVLGKQIRAAAAFAVDHPDIDRFSRSVLAERGRPVHDAVVARFGFDPDSALGALVAQGHHDGTVRRDLSLEFLQRAVLLVINHSRELLDLHAPADLDERVDELLSFLRAGLAAPPANGA